MKNSNLDMKILEVVIFAKSEIASDRLRFFRLALRFFSKTHQKKPFVGRRKHEASIDLRIPNRADKFQVELLSRTLKKTGSISL